MIETERLLLRRIATADLDELVSIHAHPAVARFMGSFGSEDVLHWMQSNKRDWDEHGYGRLAVVERATGRLLGRSGLKFWPQFEETEVGWLLRPDAWGHGFATEAGRASIAWGFQELETPRITAMIRPDNERSIAVAQRLGMTPLRGDTLFGEPVTVYSIAPSALQLGR